MYARCAPQWVCNAHLPDQPPDRGRHPGAAPPRPRLPAPHRTTVSGRTMASASRAFGNRWQTQPRTILSTAKDHTRLGLPRRSTMICCRNTRISASTAARGRNRSTTIPKISLLRSNISQKIVRFCVPRQPDRICDCACRKSNPDILVMQPAQDRTAKNVTNGSDGARHGGVLI